MKLNLKSVLTGSAATVALVAASSASASGYYIGLFGGISSLEDDFSVATSTSGGASTYGGYTTSTVTGTAAGGSYALTALGTTKASTVTWDSKQGAIYDSLQTLGTNTGITGLTTYAIASTLFSVTRGSRSTVFGTSQGFDDGWVIGAALGWDWGNGWRTELEAAYRNHDTDGGAVSGSFSRAYTYYSSISYNFTYATYGYTVQTYVGLATNSLTGTIPMFSGSGTSGKATASNTGTVSGTSSGDLETWSFMFNVWYDFDFGDSPIRPFIGGGVGFAHASLDFDMNLNSTIAPLTSYGTFGSGGYGYRGNGEATDWGFAYQLGAGLGYDLGNGMMLSAQYRYFNTGAMDLSLADQIEVNLESHNFLIGLNVPLQ